jgi:CMP-N,N'-diacetyllegionaminic acid synthase
MDTEPGSAAGALAVILARGGSKRFPGKNIRALGGVPLIGRTIRTALDSGCFRKILVSTDDELIATIAEDFGGWVPFRRPNELATDSSSSVDALWHAVSWVAESCPRELAPVVCLLQVTSPFLRPEHIQGALALMQSGGFTTLETMTRVAEQPEWMFEVDQMGRAVACHPELLTRPASSFPTRFRENGALYAMQTSFLRQEKTLYDFSRHGAFLMSTEDSVDIDTPTDWEFAEFLLSRTRSNSGG